MIKTDIVIIGAGIAGSTAAIYLKRANANFVLLEGDNVGGLLNKLERIENFPSEQLVDGKKLANSLKQQLENLDINIIKANVQTILKNNDGFEVVSDNEIFVCKAVIVACGNSKQSQFINGEEKYFGSGVSYCATCDANFFKGSDVAVIGNNNVAIEETLYLSNIVNKVYLISPANIFGDSDSISKIKNNDKIEVIENETVNEIFGNGFSVSGIKLNNREILVSGVFPYIGKKSSNRIFNSLAPKMDDNHLVVDEKMMSNIEGLFGAGDVVSKKLRQLITSASDGAVASTSALLYIRK